MSNFPAWYPVGGAAAQSEPLGWDRCELGGIVLNAWTRLTGAGGIGLKVDPRKTKGANAGHPTTHGLDTAEWTLRLRCWTLQQVEDCDDAFPLLCAPTNLKPVSIDHPQLRSIIRALGRVDVIVASSPPLWEVNGAFREASLRLLYWQPSMKQASSGKSTTPKFSTQNAVDAAAGKPPVNPQPVNQSGFGSAPANQSLP